MNDDQMMVRIQEGDRQAFDELVAAHQSNLIGFFFRNLRDRQLAEDLTQETLLRVYRQAWDYLPCGRFGGWMYRIARNLLIDHVRKRTHDALLHAVTPSADEDDSNILARIAGELGEPGTIADRNELAGLVEQLLEEIPEDQRLTFLLHHYAGLSLAEVADALETNAATAKSRLRLAREKLQALLKPHGINPATASGAE